jgi:hypothetical protein
MLRLARSLVVALCAAMLAPQAQAQAVRTQIPMATRLVQIYSDYERRLADAINRRDTGEIDRLVASDFELRSAGNIGVPTPRAEWIAQSLKEPAGSTSIGQMAVHDYGDIRIVSFVMKRAVAARRERGIAVVDVWMQSGENSVLKTRYAAVQEAQSLRVPGETRQQQIDKRY